MFQLYCKIYYGVYEIYAIYRMTIDRSANKESRRALARRIRREMKKAHNKGCYGLILTMLLDWLAIR